MSATAGAPARGHDGLAGRLVVVTGAAGGIGAAIVDELLACGAQVVSVDLAPQANMPRRACHVVTGDVRDEVTVMAAFDAAATASVPLGGLVTCTFAERRGDLESLASTDFATTFDVMATAAWQWSAEFVKRLAEQPGAIVHMASVHGVRTDHGFGTYAAAKAALLSLTRTMAIEWGAVGVRCNAVLPGFVEVPRNSALWQDPARMERIKSRTPLGRPLKPQEVATTVRFLLSADASGVTGACLPVDGGVLARLGLGDR